MPNNSLLSSIKTTHSSQEILKDVVTQNFRTATVRFPSGKGKSYYIISNIHLSNHPAETILAESSRDSRRYTSRFTPVNHV